MITKNHTCYVGNIQRIGILRISFQNPNLERPLISTLYQVRDTYFEAERVHNMSTSTTQGKYTGHLMELIWF